LCEKPRPTSRRKPCEPVSVHPRGAGHLPDRRPLPGVAGRPVRLLRLGAPRGLGACHRGCGTDDADRGGARAQSADLWGAAHPRRAARRRGALRPQAGRTADARGGPRRLPPARRTRTTVAEPAHTPAPNLVARDFRAPAPDRLWIGDITYVATAEGWLYLAVLVDVYSRRVIGWAMADHLRTELALGALRMALRARRPGAGLEVIAQPRASER